MKLSKLKEKVKIYPQVLVNAKVDNNKKSSFKEDCVINNEIKELEKEFKGNGRVLIRPSGTENVIRVMIEGEDYEYIEKKATELAGLIEERLK